MQLIWRQYKIVALALVVVLVVIGMVNFWHRNREVAVDPEKILQDSLQKTLASQSYRFSVTCNLGKDKNISQVVGERGEKNKVHIKGTLVKSPVEFIQSENNTYMKDPITDKWLTLQGNHLAEAQTLVFEFNPMSNFNFKEIPKINYLGVEKVADSEMDVLEIHPTAGIPLLEENFDVFKYKLWINRQDGLISQAQIQASKGENKNNLMTVTMKFWNYGQKFDIKQPLSK